MSSDPGGQGESPSRRELALERQALRNDWPIPPAVRKQILQRLVDFVDRDSDDGAKARPRTVIMAARTLAVFANLTVKQQVLDMRREQLDGQSEDVELTDLVAEAERRAEDRKRDRSADGPAGGVP